MPVKKTQMEDGLFLKQRRGLFYSLEHDGDARNKYDM